MFFYTVEKPPRLSEFDLEITLNIIIPNIKLATMVVKSIFLLLGDTG